MLHAETRVEGRTYREPLVGGVVFLVAAAVFLTAAPHLLADEPAFAVETSEVLGTEAQPGGPTHDFAIGLYEVTNAQFCAFLNDANANPLNERGYYLYHDTDSGSVFIGSQQNGASGDAGTGTYIFDASQTGRIAFDTDTEQYYVVDSVYASHPVGGVSWFGAVKFCNWLTIDQGLGLAARAYTEDVAANLNGWHPVTITTANWSTRDLNASERQQLVTTVLGYRLPMDHAVATAGAYNEWYKAAAWREDLQANAVYGFGRDGIGPEDANYWASGDPFEAGTTPVGMYDGTSYPASHFFPGSIAFATAVNSNGYGLYDMSGNLEEWVQDQGGSASFRRARGGYYRSATSSVEATHVLVNSVASPPGYWHGFRVARSSPYIDPQVAPDVGTTGVFTGPSGGPFEPLKHEYTITNLCWKTINWEVEAGANWLLVEGLSIATGQLGPFESVVVQVTLDNDVAELMSASDSTTLTFRDTTGSFETTRTVELELTDTLTVTPAEWFESSGPAGGPFLPASKLYQLVNDLGLPIDWTVTPTDPWVLVNGQPDASGTLSPNFSADITLSLNPAMVNTNGPGLYQTTVLFEELFGATAVRIVSLSVEDTPLIIPMAIVPGDDVQPAGPDYTFRVSTYEITNAEYAAFLNSAIRPENRANERGQHMYHDTDTGDVYLNATTNGQVGTDGVGTLLFDASDGEAITCANGVYSVSTGFETHPVVGVSWYGAVKFCNWLTLVQGGVPSDRAYTEGPQPGDWHPAVIDAASWAVRSLTSNERHDLVTGYAGYRLPMDDESSTASAYNEWYKAAAWAGDGETTYGFGRDSLTGTDANYWNSGDPYDDGTAPVGYYDGTDHGGAFATADTENRYALYDLCGNVSEWMQDFGSGPTDRATRGGHYASVQAAAELTTATAVTDLAESTRAWTGFRIVQAGSLTPITVSAPVCVTGPPCSYCVAGPAGGPFAPGSFDFTVSNPADTARQWRATADETWVKLDGGDSVESVTLPGGAQGVTISLGPDAKPLLPPATPAVAMATVTGAEAQPNGPQYTFRMGVTEVTNTDFVTFLNDALAKPGQPEGQHLYHDVDSVAVYVNTNGAGQVGTNGSGTLLFDAAYGGCVVYDDQTQQYVATNGFEDHPVVGVSWYGAIKYCNWLTLSDGLGVGARAYTEGPDPADWHPVVVDATTWGLRDLDDDERAALASNYAGYRLPMDQCVTDAAAYNEWYKAAAWDDELGTNGPYGLGADRTTLSGQDANYFGSGDPFDDGTTPAGYYDGTDHEGAFATAATSNGFYDLTGNVREWVQGWGTGPSDRGVRGGSWADPVASDALKANEREVLPANSVDARTGFRVVQANLDHVATLTFSDLSVIADLTRQVRLFTWEPMSFTPADGLSASGPFGGPFEPDDSITYRIACESDTPMQWQVTRNRTWIDINGGAQATGYLSSNGFTDVEVALNAQAAALSPGLYHATITLVNLTTGYSETRSIELLVEDVCDVTPEDSYTVSVLYGTTVTAAPKVYTLWNLSTTPIDYEVTSDEAWIDLDGGASVSGTLDPATTSGVDVSVSVNDNASALDVGTYVGTIAFANVSTGTEIHRTVELDVEDSVSVTPDTALSVLGPYGGPFDEFDPPAHTYTIANRTEGPIAWSVTADADWVLLNGQSSVGGSVVPGVPVIVLVDVDETVAVTLTEGTYPAVLSFENLNSGHVHTRDAQLVVGKYMAVDPKTGLAAYRAVDDYISPLEQTYTLTNLDTNGIDWEVVTTCGWVQVGPQSGSSASGHLDLGDWVDVRVGVDPLAAVAFASDQQCAVEFRNTTTGKGTIVRSAEVRVANPVLATPIMSAVSGTDVQPDGPEYAFEIGRYEVTNEQFLAFLNDAIAHLDDERGHFLYHDTDSGDVYIHSQQTGEVGSNGTGTFIFNAAAAGRITYDDQAHEYAMTTNGYADHPAVGMSWYGAAKFCNWLTLDQGYAPGERCYSEGTDADLNAWKPVTITAADWAVRAMTDDERLDLVTNYRGYRLPMDNGGRSGIYDIDVARAYNEWYKAAAWREDLQANRLYGFGRDTAGPADANYLDSTDPWDNTTTPIGYYDGTDHGSVFATNATSNGYGLYDMAGNVFELVQDYYYDGPGLLGHRAVRGGSWLKPVGANTWIEAYKRTKHVPSSAVSHVGLRVVKIGAGTPGDLDADGDVDLDDFTQFVQCLSGPATDPPQDCEAADLNSDGNVDLTDFSGFQRAYTGPG